VRAQSKYLVTIGACATAGGIQALRNFADVKEFTRVVYATPEYIETLETSTPIADHVRSTSSCAAARSTSAAARGDQRLPARAQAEHPPTASASSASCAATSA
jgi:hypothetical protein